MPVPEGEVVDSPEEAWEAAEDIGLPGGGQAHRRQPRPGRVRWT